MVESMPHMPGGVITSHVMPAGIKEIHFENYHISINGVVKYNKECLPGINWTRILPRKLQEALGLWLQAMSDIVGNISGPVHPWQAFLFYHLLSVTDRPEAVTFNM